MSKINDSEIALEQNKKWSKEIKIKIANKVKDLLEGSTSHGIPNIMRTSRISIKILWTICFLVALAACSYMVIKSISDYLEYETVSKIEYITEIPTKFPTFSFCNINPFTTAESEYYILSLMESLGYNKSTELENASLGLNYSLIAFTIGILDSNVPSFGDDNRKKLGFNLSSLLFSCVYNGNPCNETQFEWYYDLVYGNCFRFNSGKDSNGNVIDLSESVKSGPDYGLLLGLYLRPSNNKYSSTFYEGLRVFIHNNSIKPTDSDGINIELAKKTDINVQRTFIQKEPYPYSDCIDLDNYDSDYYKLLDGLNKTYRQQDCFNLCLQKKITENCSCYDLSFPMIFNSTPCNFEKLRCSFTVYNDFIKKKVDDECLKQCPLECESIEYDLLISSASSLSKQAYQLYQQIIDNFTSRFDEYNLTYEEIKERLLILNIYYSKLSYIKISESSKTSIIDLLSNLGGTLGLYVGISFLSLIEIVEIVLEIIFISFNLNF